MHHPHPASRPGSRRLARPLLLVLLAAALAAICQGTLAAGPTAEVRDLAARWLAVEQQHQRLVGEWEREEPQLALRLELLEREREQLKTAIAGHAENTDSVEQAREELLRAQQRFEAEQARIARFSEDLKHRATALQPRLPPPLARAWQARLDELPEDDNPSTKLQCYLDLFSLLEDFQRVATATEGPITLPSGQTLHVRQLYLGAARAWYVSADGANRGTGYPGPGGWVWEADPALDPGLVATAIEMSDGRGGHQLLSLPVRLDTAGGGASIAEAGREP